MFKQQEVWRQIADAPIYDISSLGRVRNHDRHVKTSNGQTRFYRGGMISPAHNQHGHEKVLLIVAPGVKIMRYIHALVAAAFIGQRPIGHEIAHNDGNPRNNTVGNLRYATPKENNSDKIQHGTLLKRAGHPSAKLTESDVADIRIRLAAKHRQKDIAADFCVTRATIGAIALGRSWNDAPMKVAA